MRGSLDSHAISREAAASSPPQIFSALDTMRYQRLSPEGHAVGGGGRKPGSRSSKDDDAEAIAPPRIPNYSPLEAKALRGRSSSVQSPLRDPHPHFYAMPSDSPTSETSIPAAAAATSTSTSLYACATAQSTGPASRAQISTHHEINGVCNGGGGGGGGGDLLLQWGHNKRSRGSSAHARAASKVQQRSSAPSAANAAFAAAEKLMPPPLPPCGSYTRGSNLRPATLPRDPGLHPHRGVEERSGGQSRSEKRSLSATAEKAQMASVNGCAERQMGSAEAAKQAAAAAPDHDPMAVGSNNNGEKLNLDQFEWPRIYISLSRKEKEDDFLAMKGTKLPQRPKKRAKNVDKTLQYCFPGMWLSDLTRGRYEVREKKCVKKKRRGLKGMESMDSDSE